MVRTRVLPCLLFSLLVFVGQAILVSQAQAQSIPPRIFYTDLVNGPANGGQSSQGAFVTIYGNNFGSTRGTSFVQLNGQNVYSYPVWTNNKITVQIASGSTTGKLVVNVNGAVSNGLTFTVRSGRIFFVSTSGSDSNSGSYSSPWATLLKARSTAIAGDTVYVMNGVQQTGADLSSASWTLSTSGTSTTPIAFVAYPNATVTIGSATGQTFGVRTAPNTSPKWIVIAGMKILGATTAVDFTSGYNWRLVGNDISCPNASGTSACVNAKAAGGSKLYGNNVHDAGYASASSLIQYDAVSLTGINTLDIGWNEIARVRGCEAITVGGTNGTANYNLKIHDNFIHDVRCNGVRVEKVDTTLGAVNLWNNLLVRTGTGPAPAGVEADSYAGISVRPTSAGQVNASDNTFYDCGARKNSNSGCVKPDSPTAFIDNIFQVTSGESYIASSSSSSNSTGSNNLFFGAGSAPSVFTSSVSGDAKFANPTGNDFRLSSGSAAIDTGVKTAYTTDLAGTWRPKGTAFDIGAYEYTGISGSTTGASLSASPTSLSFGSVTVGSSSTLSGTLTNSSTSTSISVSAASVTGSGFSVSGLSFPVTIAPGASVNYSAKFAPSATGSISGSISFVSNATNSPTAVTLSGSGTTASVGTLAANPTSVAFGSITTGTTLTKTVTLSNSGSANLSISAASVSGGGFTVSGITTPLTLTPGQTASLSVKFAPTTAASFTGSVTLTSNASNPSLAIPLSGTGATSTSHSVALTWTASTTSGVTGYNVYRSTTSGSGYAKIDTSLVSGTTYTDTSVASGTTYYYVVRSVSSTGLESANSSQVTAIVP
jgi:hypothetical protein